MAVEVEGGIWWLWKVREESCGCGRGGRDLGAVEVREESCGCGRGGRDLVAVEVREGSCGCIS